MMHKITCTDIEENLIEYAEGRLGNDIARAVDSHIEGCSACAELIVEAKQLFSSEVPGTSEQAPETLWRSIQNEINQIDEGRHKQPTLLSTRRPFVRFSLQSLGAAAALLIGIYLGSGAVQNGEASELTYEDQLVEYYASAFQAESAIPVSEVVYDLEESTGGE